MNYRIGIQILSYNKPHYLRQTLTSLISKIGSRDKICVYEQSDKEFQDECISICQEFENMHLIISDKNRGQRGATNAVFKSRFFNDCEYVMLSDHDNIFHEDLTIYCDKLNSDPSVWIATAYNSPEHDFERKDGEWIRKSSARAGHMVLRAKNFLSMCPIDEDYGSKTPDLNCAWFAGLDWWLTHWSPSSPGHKKPEIVAVYSGGAEHIGRESTWQGHYDDEYDLPTLNWFRTATTYDIVKKYPPRHTYMSYKYWYEKVDLESLNEKSTNSAVNTDLQSLFKNKLGIDLGDISKIINPIKPKPKDEKTITVGFSTNSNKSNIIVFNYMWPKYGFQFLESSIRSVLPYVKKYVLFLNKYSYIGTPCSDENIQFVKNVISKFGDSIELIYNEEMNHPQEMKDDDVKYYTYKTIELFHNQSDYIWYMSPDEIYEKHIIDDIIGLTKDCQLKQCVATQPICYFDNPHWCVNPPEFFDRASIIPNILGIDINDKIIMNHLSFHHLSYVMTSDELNFKFKNWTHRKDVLPNINSFFNLFNQLKTNKNVQHFHPVNPRLYNHLSFVNIKLNTELFYEWIYYLMFNSNYDIVDKSIVNKFIMSVLSNSIPNNGTFVEIGSKLGNTLNLCNVVQSKVKRIGIESNYDIYRLSIINSINQNISNCIIYGEPKNIVCNLHNESIDCLFINNPGDPNFCKTSIIECWPKMKDFSIIFGTYDPNDKSMIESIKQVVSKTIAVECPWGSNVFSTHELYYNILEDIAKYKGVKFDNSLSIWFARIRKT